MLTHPGKSSGFLLRCQPAFGRLAQYLATREELLRQEELGDIAVFDQPVTVAKFIN